MIVTCEQCTTQFKLDDAKIPPGGARVRCSRCQHAFFIEPPHQDDASRIDALTRDAIHSEPSPPAAAESAAPGDDGDAGEADWKFNEDAPEPEEPGIDGFPMEESGPVPDLAAAREAVDDLLGADDAHPSGPKPDLRVEDLGGDDLDTGDLDLELAGPAPGSPASRDTSETRGEESPDPRGPEARIEAAAAALGPAKSVQGEAGAGKNRDLTSVVDALAREEIDDDLGSPQGWDFFSEKEGDSEKTPVARVELVPRWKLLEQEREGQEGAPVAPDLEEERGPLSRGLRRVGGALGWTATTLLILAGAWTNLGPGRTAGTPAAAVQRLGGLEAEVVASRWIDNAVAGPIYVMSGQLRSTRGAEPIAVGGLGIELLDASGAPLDLPALPVATPLHPTHVRENAPSELVAELEAGARRLARNRLRTGDSVPFQAIIASLPPAAVRFRLVQTASEPEAPAPPAPSGAGGVDPGAAPGAGAPSGGAPSA